MELSQFLEDLGGQLADDHVRIKETDILRELDAWDSLTGMAVLYMIVEKYGVTIPIDEFVKLQTPRDIFEYVQNKIKS